MTVLSRLHTLEERHRSLDEEIKRRASRNSSNDLNIAKLKKKKLKLKEEIERLQK